MSCARLTNAIAATLLLLASAADAQPAGSHHWVDIWGSMPQLVEYYNLPNPPFNASGMVFENATLRQTVYITQDAETIRLQFSNAYSVSDLPITAMTVALPHSGAAGDSAVRPETIRPVTFGGHTNFIVPDGSVVLSDPLEFPVKAQSVLTVTTYLATGQTTNYITGHPGSRTTSYFAPGNLVDAANVTGPDVQNAAHWYFLSTIEGWLPASSSALVVVGDSITDGRGSDTDGNDRWPDQLLARLQAGPAATRGVAVINEAAGGNRVLYDGLGPNALGRIDRDVIAQSGVRYALVYEGVNDIGSAGADPATQEGMSMRIIAAYDQMITRLHRFGIAVFGATITPFCGPGQPYSDPNREAARQRINAWIRGAGRFDAVVDFDAAVRDPANATQLNPLYNFGDWLHMNPAGYKVLAEAVDLSLFTTFANGVQSMT